MSDLSELAERAARGASGDALACVTRERSLLMRFAANRPTQATSIDDTTVELAVARDGHVGRATTNGTSGHALAECARRAEAAAAAGAAAGPGAFPGFAAPGEVPPHEGHDAATAALEPEPGGRALAEAFAVAETAGVEAHGIWTAAEERRAVSSAGVTVSDRTTDAYMKVICLAPGGRSGYAARASVAAADLDAGALCRRAADKAVFPGEALALAPGEHTVVMEPHAVGVLLDLLGACAFNGLAHAEGRGALVGRLGRSVASPAVNLSDSPRYRHQLQRGIDAEGTTKRPVPLIQDGVAHSVVHDRRSAVLAGTESTGHALAPGGDPEGPVPANLVLGGGGAADEHDLCSGVERGVYVTRLWYGNVIRPKEALVTAVTRDGTFLIEDGRITRPAGDLRLTDSALGILSRVQALGARQTLVSEAEYYERRFAHAQACPPVRVRDVRFTGSAVRA